MRVVVVGAGVLGLWTAVWLRRHGHDVTVLDQYGPGSPLASSIDETRINRSAHGTDEHYPVWQRRALDQWLALEAEGTTSLIARTGVLWFAHREDGFESASLAVLSRLGIPAERWSTDDIQARNPAIGVEDLAWALHEPEGGAYMARRAIAALAARFAADGGKLHIGTATLNSQKTSGPSVGRLKLADGGTLEADAFVFACGPWLPRLFPDLLGNTILVTRRDVMHFATPPGDARFNGELMPAWVDYDRAMYGCPSIDNRGFKCCPDWSGQAVDPDHLDRRVSDEAIEASRAYMRSRFPALADQPVAEGWVSQYESTPDTHFVIDRHPHWHDAWVVGGGSGHAFKHGPVVGEYVAALIDGDKARIADLAPPDQRFALGPRESRPGVRTSAQD